MLDFAELCIALQKNLLKKARIMLNTSQIMLDFAKLCLALMLNAKRLKIMPKSIIMLNMATLIESNVFFLQVFLHSIYIHIFTTKKLVTTIGM